MLMCRKFTGQHAHYIRHMHTNSRHASRHVYVRYARSLTRRPAPPALQCTFWRFIGALFYVPSGRPDNDHEQCDEQLHAQLAQRRAVLRAMPGGRTRQLLPTPPYPESACDAGMAVLGHDAAALRRR